VTRRNNLDGVRIVGALLVMLGHAYVLTGRPPRSSLGFSVQTFGVVVFFSISGYLITRSWVARRDLVAYAAARCLRIFPALAVVVAFTALVVGPLLTSGTVVDYFGSDLVAGYFRNVALYPTHVLPGVTSDLPYPDSINGSPWTLPMEFACYLAVPLVSVRRLPVALVAKTALLGLALAQAHVPHTEAAFWWGTNTQSFAAFAVFFIVGSVIADLQRASKGRFLRADVAVGLFAAHLLMLSLATPVQVTWLSWIALPYAVLAVGLASTPYVRRTARFGDFSYGLYLWAFPVQQAVISVFGVTRMSVNLALVGTFTLLCAVVSWHLVEKPSLALKEILVRRSARAAGTATEATHQEPAPV
jgi:peptidoglycan/LPS O-acetylase OafA/YrhL